MCSTIIPTDLFLILPTQDGIENAVFAKNSHRPKNEVQEVIYVKGGERESPKLQCTYIEIDEIKSPVNSVFLSKPAWCWGAEMGANDRNVVIGNIAVLSRFNVGDADASVKRLLGADLVRLGLERGSSAEECMDVIANLIEKYGQGGSWTEQDTGAYYQNSFVIVDLNEAWLLETCGKFWAAHRIVSSYEHFTNGYVIHGDVDIMSDKLAENAKALNLWNGEGQFDFGKCFSISVANGCNNDGDHLLETIADKPTLNITDIFDVLRNKKNNICHSADDLYPTQASFVSCLYENAPSLHWFTATPDPTVSVFKPFVFTPNAITSQYTVSARDDPMHRHQLYSLHSNQNFNESQMTLDLLREMEIGCVSELTDYIEKYDAEMANYDELDEIMKDCVETEVKFYR